MTLVREVPRPTPFTSLWLIVRSCQPVERVGVTANQGFPFGSGPTLDLRFAAAGIGERRVRFAVHDRDGRVQPGRATCFTGDVFLPAAVEIGRGADVELTGSETEDVKVSGHGLSTHSVCSRPFRRVHPLLCGRRP